MLLESRRQWARLHAATNSSLSTAAQQALAAGFSALAAHHGQQWTFGAATFVGVLGTLRPDDPRMIGARDRVIVLQVLEANLPTPHPKRGDTLQSGGRRYTVSRVDRDDATGIVSLLISDGGVA